MLIINPRERIVEYASSAPDGPIVMINLFKVKDGIDVLEFGIKLNRIVKPLLDKLGADSVYSGIAGPEFCAEDNWDLVSLVKYPNYQAFLTLGTDAGWIAEAGKLREEQLEDTRLILTQPPAL